MSKNTESHQIQELIKGFFLLMICHVLAGVIIFLLSFILGSILGGYTLLVVWFVGAIGFLFWQLLYVIPLTLYLKHQGKIGLMKGVIMGAVCTALVNGACFALIK